MLNNQIARKIKVNILSYVLLSKIQILRKIIKIHLVVSSSPIVIGEKIQGNIYSIPSIKEKEFISRLVKTEKDSGKGQRQF